MKLFKLLLIVLALVLLVVGGMALFGLFVALLKWGAIFGVLALAGVGAYKLLSKSSEPQLELSPAEAEMMKAARALAELKRRQLSK